MILKLGIFFIAIGITKLIVSAIMCKMENGRSNEPRRETEKHSI